MRFQVTKHNWASGSSLYPHFSWNIREKCERTSKEVWNFNVSTDVRHSKRDWRQTETASYCWQVVSYWFLGWGTDYWIVSVTLSHSFPQSSPAALVFSCDTIPLELVFRKPEHIFLSDHSKGTWISKCFNYTSHLWTNFDIVDEQDSLWGKHCVPGSIYSQSITVLVSIYLTPYILKICETYLHS